MKRLLSIIFLVALTACKSPEQAAYVSVGSVGATANAAIGAYSEYIKSHTVPAGQIASVRQAVQAYIAANESARAAVTAYKNGHGTKETADIALDALAASSSQVVSLINIVTAGN